jgi:cysteine-rich repeat protein
VCRNLWAGTNCDICPVNVDPVTDCSECGGNWGGDTCTACRGNWDLQANCTTCLAGWQDSGDDCGTCTPGLEGAGCQETCGNGVATTNEACDDGNPISWDGCDACNIREQRINTTGADEDSKPAIAASPSGAMVVVWLKASAATGMRTIVGQKFSASGQPEGAEFQVTESASAAIDRPAVDMADDESFTVVWENDTTIERRRFDITGSPIGLEEKISGTSVASFPAIAIAANGHGAVVWVDTETTSSSISGISFDPDGVTQNQLSFGSAVVDDGAPFAKTPSVAINANGAPVVAYVHERRFGGATFLYCDKVIYSSGSGESYAEPGCASSVDESNPHISVSQAGLILLTWVKLSAGVRTVSGRYLNGSSLLDLGSGQAGVAPRVAIFAGNVGAVVKVNGQAVQQRRFSSGAAEDVVVNDLAGATSPAADIAALPNGDYAIVWSATVNPNDGADIMGVRVGSDGGALPWIH